MNKEETNLNEESIPESSIDSKFLDDEIENNQFIKHNFLKYSKKVTISQSINHSWPLKALEITKNNTCGIRYSACGKFIATSELNFINIWNAKEYNKMFSLYGHLKKVSCLSFSPNRKYLASGSHDKALKIWNMHQKKEKYTIYGKSKIVDISYCPKGIYLASCSADKVIIIWNLLDKTEKIIYRGDLASTIEYSPDSLYLAIGLQNSCFKLFKLETKENFYLKELLCISFAPDKIHIATGTVDQKIKIMDINNFNEVLTFKGHFSLCLSYSLEGNLLASGQYDKSVILWNIKKKGIEFIFYGHFSQVTNISFSPNSRFFATSSLDGNIKVWNIKEKKEESNLNGHTSAVSCISFSPNGLMLQQDHLTRL